MSRIKSNIPNQQKASINMANKFPNKLQMNNTPIKVRNIATKQNNAHLRNNLKHLNLHNQPNQHQNLASLSQNNARTIPKRKVEMSEKRCVNHNDSQAEFRISIEEEYIHYCSKCAINLASNGFQVQRLSAKSPKLHKQIKTPLMKKQQELLSFITTLKKIQLECKNKRQNLQQIQCNYKNQKQIIFTFYNSIYEYIQNVRDQHFQYLSSQSQRNIQICEIQGDQVAETLEEIDGIYHDIENNMGKIIQDVQESSYMECMNHYHQKYHIYDHRLEEIGLQIKAANCTTAECIENKLTAFKLFVDDITGMLSSKASERDY